MATLLATDTNFHLHYRSIDKLHPGDLFAGAEAWLIAATVLGELDEREHKPVEEKSRDRAKREKKVLGNAIESGNPLPTGARIHYARPPVSYAGHNVNADIADERILGDLLRYRDEHPDDDIVVVSHDLRMRLAARDHGFAVLDPPENVRVKDIPTTTERELAKSRARVQELESAMPCLELAFAGRDGSDKAVAVSAMLPNETIDSIINGIEPDPREPFLQPQPGGFVHNPWYDQEFNEYLEELRRYIAEHDRFTHRLTPLDFAIKNVGLKRAEEIDIELTLPPIGILAEELPELPDPPVLPTRYPYAKHMYPATPVIPDLSGLRPRVASVYREQSAPKDSGPEVTLNPSGDKIAYHIVKVPQHDVKLLPHAYLALNDTFSGATVPIDYRIRAANASGETTGRLHLRLRWGPPDGSTLPEFNSLMYRILSARSASQRKKRR